MLVPIVLTGFYYALPSPLQETRLIQFVPQLSAYLALGVWCLCNSKLAERLWLKPDGFWVGTKYGLMTGLLLGGINTFVILWVVPSIGGDIMFLKETPHAKVSSWVMVPWGIFLIALGVELNFRGFLLGRQEALFFQWFSVPPYYFLKAGPILAVVSSALVFAFDPFMVATFQHLHWIAVWDGLIWGWILVRKQTLYAVIVAHAVEVVILYLSVKAALT